MSISEYIAYLQSETSKVITIQLTNNTNGHRVLMKLMNEITVMMIIIYPMNYVVLM